MENSPEVQYPPGALVRFTDSNATVRLTDKKVVLAEGTVNGDPLDVGDRVLVPVWTARAGRESTTVYVDTRNIVDVELPG